MKNGKTREREMRDERARRGKGKDMQEQICATAF